MLTKVPFRAEYLLSVQRSTMSVTLFTLILTPQCTFFKTEYQIEKIIEK